MFNQIFEEANKKIVNLLICALVLFVAALAVVKAIDIKDKIWEPVARNTISVSGTGTVYVKPDLAQANFSVVTEDQTVAEALRQNTAKMNAVISAMKEAGIEDKDIKTTVFNIYPRYEWPDNGDYFPGERVLVGYEVTQSIEVKIRNLEKAGEILQKAADAGANETVNLQFTVENQDEVKSQARAEAIKKSKDKAKELSRQLGIKLGKIMYFDEQGAQPYYFSTDKSMGMGGDGAPSPQIQTGENKIEVTVSITYEIR